ncbi:MAG TPA: hypothetical protein VFV28_00980 [Limnobacter sp.]|nr:hypothetical protein [Limnobacter sp.]
MMIARTTTAGVKDALIFHSVFFALAIPVALNLQGNNLGIALLVFAITYNIALPLAGKLRGHDEWVKLWKFLLPVSIALPCADWMLVERMGTLYFPDHGIPRLGGAVPLYFMGLWIMLLWQVCWFSMATPRPYPVVAALSLSGFLVWEWAARPMDLWHAQHVFQVEGFAVYPLIPEMFLAVGALWLWQTLHNSPFLNQLAGGLALAVFYAGALSLSLLWIG